MVSYQVIFREDRGKIRTDFTLDRVSLFNMSDEAREEYILRTAVNQIKEELDVDVENWDHEIIEIK